MQIERAIVLKQQSPSLLDIVQCMLLIIKFVGGKSRDLYVNHKNNENWYPTINNPLYDI